MMQWQLEQCTVRRYREEDAASLARHGDSLEVWRNLRDRFPRPFAEADAAAYITRCASMDPVTSWCIEVDGEAAGGVSLHVGTDVERVGAEIGYWLGEAYWGRGVMTEVVRAVTDDAFAAFGLTRVFALPYSTSVASHRVLEKVGYDREGVLRRSAVKLGEVLDQVVYARVV